MRNIHYYFLILIFCSCGVSNIPIESKKVPEIEKNLKSWLSDSVIVSCNSLSKTFYHRKGSGNFIGRDWYDLIGCLIDDAYKGDTLAIDQLIFIFNESSDYLFSRYMMNEKYKFRGEIMYEYLLHNMNRFECILDSHGGYDVNTLPTYVISKILEMSKPINNISAKEHFEEIIKDFSWKDFSYDDHNDNDNDNCSVFLSKAKQNILNKMIEDGKIELKLYNEN